MIRCYFYYWDYCCACADMCELEWWWEWSVCGLVLLSFYLCTSCELTDWILDHSECVQCERAQGAQQDKKISTEETIVREGRTVWLWTISTADWSVQHSHLQHCAGWEFTCWTWWALCVRPWRVWLHLCGCVDLWCEYEETTEIRVFWAEEWESVWVVDLPSYSEIV